MAYGGGLGINGGGAIVSATTWEGTRAISHTSTASGGGLGFRELRIHCGEGGLRKDEAPAGDATTLECEGALAGHL